MKNTPLHCNRAFSLLEILAVLAVMVLLMGFSVPALRVISNADLLNSTELIQREILQARQTAIRENREVEVRFFYINDIFSADNSTEFRAIQYVKYETDSKGNKTAVPISNLKTLPGDIIIANNSTYSTLVTAPDLKGATPAKVGSSKSTAPYFSFKFLPDGSTNLPDDVAGAWFFTVVEGSQWALSNGQLPKNYITFQIEPFSGIINHYQPGA